MTQSTQSVSPLRQRMTEDMHMRKLAPKTQASYIYAVKKLADYLGHSPHIATAEDLRKLSVVLSREEVSRLLEATSSLKYKASFSVAYGAGLRMSEVATLKISDIDSERKTLHVEQGTKSRRFRRGA